MRSARSPHTSSRRLPEITWIGVDPRKSRRTTPRGRGGARRRRALPLVRASGRRDPIRRRSPAVLSVIRRRLEDTVKMAVVSALARRPLEQVGGGSGGPDHLARSLSPALSVLFLSPPGLGAAEEALPPDGAGGAAGNAGTPQGPSSQGEAGVAPARWRVGAEGRGGERRRRRPGSRVRPGTRAASAAAQRPGPAPSPACCPSMGAPSEGTSLDAFPPSTPPPLS